MFDELLKLVKENAGSAIVDNPAIPNQQNDAAISTATTGIMDQLKSAVSSGGIGQITDMFSGGNAANSPMVKNISDGVAKTLVSKFGISNEQANGIVQSLIPKVMGSLVSKTNDPNDKSFDLNGVIGSLTGGGASGDLMGKLKNMF
ncbi:MAG TPA: DUF937 domain-containing protein [Bacteroidia bacterium]|nr:DUF937 domain-containing protein [Bacteroidia bacterium]